MLHSHLLSAALQPVCADLFDCDNEWLVSGDQLNMNLTAAGSLKTYIEQQNATENKERLQVQV